MRGVAAGAALAIVVLTIATMMSIYYILATYKSAQRSLQEYALAAQKPQLQISSVKVTNGQIVVTITNNGPIPATVYDVKIYRYDNSGIPVAAVEGVMTTKPAYLPVGGSITVTFNTPLDVTDYIYWGRPLRVEVDTGKGPILVSYPLQVGTIYVNIRLPEWVGKTSNIAYILRDLELMVNGPDGSYTIPLGTAVYKTCSSGSQTPTIRLSRSFGYTLCTIPPIRGGLGYTVVARLAAIAGYEYKISLVGDMMMPGIQGPNDKVMRGGDNFAPRYIYEPVRLVYSSEVSVSPNGVVSVDITIPNVIWQVGKLFKIIQPNNGNNGWVIDFSWYFNNMRMGQLGYGAAARMIGLGTNEKSDSDYETGMKILTLAGWLLYDKVFTYNNPYGCDVYPVPVAPRNMHPSVPSDVVDLANRAYMAEVGGDDYTTGIPIIIYRYPYSCTRRIPSYYYTTVLSIKANIRLSRGSYVVIPVFTVDDTDDVSTFNILVTLTNSYGQTIAVASSREYENGGKANQYAIPLFVHVDADGVYKLSINLEGRWINHEDNVIIVLSKIVILPSLTGSEVCMYTDDWMPWVAIDTKTGQVDREVYADLYALTNHVTSISQGAAIKYTQPNIPTSWTRVLTFYMTSNRFWFGYRYYYMPYPYKYLNELGTVNIYFKTNATDNNDRLNEVKVYVAGGNSPESASYMYKFDTPDIVNEFMRRGYTIVFSATYWRYTDNNMKTGAVFIKIDIPTDLLNAEYIVLPIIYDAGGDVEIPYSITVSGGAIVNEHAIYTNNDRSGYFLYLIRIQNHYRVEITITMPAPRGEDSTLAKLFHDTSYLGIGAIAVISNKLTMYSATPISGNIYMIGSGIPAGLVLYNVQSADGFRPVVLKIYDDEGSLVYNKTLPYGNNFLISVEELNKYLGFDFWTYPYRHLYLVLENAKCTNPAPSSSP